jgi:hypothetical protein
MTTAKSNATASPNDPSDLIARASRSTANLGWLQDYTLNWQTARSVCIRLAGLQNQLPTKDEEAYDTLLAFIAFATHKCERLEAALLTKREQHERLMIRLNEEIGRD